MDDDVGRPPARDIGGCRWLCAEGDGDKRKATLASCLFFLMFVAVLAVSTILGGAGDRADLDSPSTQRRAVARWWGNSTVDPCVNFYNYSCQGYERMAPVGLSVLAQTHVYVVGKNQSYPPTDNASVIMDGALPSEIGIFPFYAVETRYQNVYVYTLEDDEDPTPNISGVVGGRARLGRRTLEQVSKQLVTASVPKVAGYTTIINDTIDTFNAWITDPEISVWIVNDQNRADDVDDGRWFVDMSHGCNGVCNASEFAAEADECIEAQINASHHWSSMFYNPQVSCPFFSPVTIRSPARHHPLTLGGGVGDRRLRVSTWPQTTSSRALSIAWLLC
jgi:hypothetical protein